MISEEHIEFVDWSKIPIKYITPDIVQKFVSSVDGLKTRIWFEDLLSQMEIKIDENKFPGNIFFFIRNKWYMNYDKKNERLWCSTYIWKFFDVNYSIDYSESRNFIKNVVEQYYKNVSGEPIEGKGINYLYLEDCFKDVKPQAAKILDSSKEVLSHFKIKSGNKFDFSPFINRKKI